MPIFALVLVGIIFISSQSIIAFAEPQVTVTTEFQNSGITAWISGTGFEPSVTVQMEMISQDLLYDNHPNLVSKSHTTDSQGNFRGQLHTGMYTESGNYLIKITDPFTTYEFEQYVVFKTHPEDNYKLTPSQIILDGSPIDVKGTSQVYWYKDPQTISVSVIIDDRLWWFGEKTTIATDGTFRIIANGAEVLELIKQENIPSGSTVEIESNLLD